VQPHGRPYAIEIGLRSFPPPVMGSVLLRAKQPGQNFRKAPARKLVTPVGGGCHDTTASRRIHAGRMAHRHPHDA